MKTYMNKIKSEIITITPEIAKLWLTIYNKKNRRIYPARIRKYIRDIEAGLWKLNGESIKISDQNILLDGQHRLMAVAQCGRQIETVVTTNIPGEHGVFETIDAGAPRSAADAMRLEGLQYAALVPAIVRAVADYDSGTSWDRSMSHVEVKSIIDKDYSSFADAAKAGDEMKHVVIPSSWGAFYYMAEKHWPESISAFHDKIKNMTNISEGSPIIALNKAFAQLPRKSRTDKIGIIERCIIAFNAYLQGQKMKQIRLSKKRAEILK